MIDKQIPHLYTPLGIGGRNLGRLGIPPWYVNLGGVSYLLQHHYEIIITYIGWMTSGKSGI